MEQVEVRPGSVRLECRCRWGATVMVVKGRKIRIIRRPTYRYRDVRVSEACSLEVFDLADPASGPVVFGEGLSPVAHDWLMCEMARVLGPDTLQAPPDGEAGEE